MNNIYSASLYKAITPSDTGYLAYSTLDGQVLFPRSFYVGTAGDLVLKDREGVETTFYGVPTGSIIPVQAQFVMAATSASQIVALY